MLQPYMQIADPVAHSLALSSFFALLPLLVMFVLLGGLRWSPLAAGVWALIVAMAVAVVAYGMPVGATVHSALFGAVFSILNVIFIVIDAIWIHNMLVKSGYFDVVRRTFAIVSSDLRVQAILIAFCFGGLLEALAGAGTPIAIVAVMLVALGMNPLKAVVCALVADTAPVAFGALAVPVVTLAAVTGQPFNLLGAIIGRQTPVLAVVVPFVLVWIVDGRRGLKQVWPAALIAGLAFGLAQFVCSNYISVPLSDIFAAFCRRRRGGGFGAGVEAKRGHGDAARRQRRRGDQGGGGARQPARPRDRLHAVYVDRGGFHHRAIPGGRPLAEHRDWSSSLGQAWRSRPPRGRPWAPRWLCR